MPKTHFFNNIDSYEQDGVKITKKEPNSFLITLGTKNLHLWQCAKNRLEELSVYKQSTLMPNTDDYISFWHTRVCKSAIIKSTDTKKALILSGENVKYDDLDILFTIQYLFPLDYFQERRFCNLLQKGYSISIEDLATRKGFDQTRINLLMGNLIAFNRLIRNKISLDELAQINIKVLKKYCENYCFEEDALKFVPFKKILQLTDESSSLKTKVIRSQSNFDAIINEEKGEHSGTISLLKSHLIEYSCSKKSGEFSCKNLVNNTITSFSFKITENPEKPDMRKLTCHTLINLWNCEQLDEETTCYYDKDITVKITVIMDKEFPFLALLSNPYCPLWLAPKFREDYFICFLNNYGYSLEQIKSLREKDKPKLQLYCEVQEYIKPFIIDGSFSLNQLFNADIDKIKQCIFHNNHVKNALRLINNSQLLGLPAESIVVENGETMEVKKKSSMVSCMLM